MEETQRQDPIAALPVVWSDEAHPHDFGVRVNEQFLLWHVRLDPASRRLRTLKKRINKLINLFTWFVTSLCFVILLASTLLLLPAGTWATGAFWTEPSFEQLWLWLAVSGVLYAVYRRARARREPKERGTRTVQEIALAPSSWEQEQAKKGQWVKIAERFNHAAWEGVDQAADLATSFKHGSLAILHVFAGQLSQPSVGHVFARLGLTFNDIKDPLARKLQALPKAEGALVASVDQDAQRAILGAYVHALQQGRTVVTPVDLFVSCYRNSEFLREVFYAVGVEHEAMENVLAWLQIREAMRARWQAFREAAWLKPAGNMNRAMTAVATPLLDGISTDLTARAVRGGLPLLVGREAEMQRLLRVFEGGGRSVVLVGHRGVGKQAMIDGLTQLMVEERVPELLKDRRLVSIDVGRLVAGASPAEAEERLLMALNEVAKSRNIALAIPNIDDIVGISAGSGESLDLASLLATEMEKGYFVAVATTTPQAYASSIEGGALGSVMTKVAIEEPEKNLAIRIVESKVNRPEYEHKVIFSYAAVEAAVELTGRYVHEQALPEKAIRVLDEVALAVKQERGEGQTVTREDVAKVVSSISNIPLTSVNQDESQKLLNLETEMHKRMIGQNEAVNAVAAALRRARTELRSGGRPIANFLFLGPTGVGKTELAKTIAETYFGDENAMIRLDMSEYQEQSSINRLLGAPGSNQGGVFTEAVRKQPFALVLLDELEKAHPEILNVFLQVMDDGRLTDAAGRTIDFTQTILVATSNAGAAYIQQGVKQQVSMDEMKTHLIEEELSKHYRPEFLNRFDGVIVFTPLSPENVMAIAGLMLGGVRGRLEEKGMNFTVTDAALKELATAGYDPQFGARPLRRVIQERVEDPLATLLLQGGAERRDTIVLDAGGEMRVEKAAAL